MLLSTIKKSYIDNDDEMKVIFFSNKVDEDFSSPLYSNDGIVINKGMLQYKM